MLLPLNDFNKIRESKKVFASTSQLSTPASSEIIDRLMLLDTVNINHDRFSVVVSSSESIKERLIGLLFFRRFDYVIFDFINKQIYIPKKAG
ncbi:MAG: hypothetical protein K2Q21_05340 [Chitinophagaceae bacterium]|nr:hypothetical protein [Chitinophagaceae bacterium]